MNDNWLDVQFAWNERLGIAVPRFTLPWEEMNPAEQASVLDRWEEMRGRIPDRVMKLEAAIRVKLEAMFEVEDFRASCELNSEIAELASRINDLHIWYRTEQDLREETKRHS